MAKRTAKEIIEVMDTIRTGMSKNVAKEPVLDLGRTRKRKFVPTSTLGIDGDVPETIWASARLWVVDRDKDLPRKMGKAAAEAFFEEIRRIREDAEDKFQSACLKKFGKKKLTAILGKRDVWVRDKEIQQYEHYIATAGNKAIQAFEKTLAKELSKSEKKMKP